MAKIQVLDAGTIDKIAAGEVVERPASVVKELVENAIDAKASSVTVEIKEGGISFIRITDNGSGIEASEVRNAFLRHATSKITTAEDLHSIKSLGFRGEALSSIAAVAKVELITKTKDSLTGVRYLCEGAEEKEFSEVGAPDGTTIIIRNLFFNTPVRRKFLKQPQTEGGYVIDLMEHMALSRPDVAFKLTVNNQLKFNTSGNGNLKEVIYRIYGRETAANLVEIQAERQGIAVSGYLGKPVLNRSTRSFETYFLNGRYIKSNVMAKAIEDGFRQYLMQHKFPFVVLHFAMDTALVDVNVHPTKMDVRFTDGSRIYEFITEAVAEALQEKEMIPEAVLDNPAVKKTDGAVPKTDAGKALLSSDRTEEKTSVQEPKVSVLEPKVSVPEPFEVKRAAQFRVMEEMKYEADKPKMQDFMQNPVWEKMSEQSFGTKMQENEGILASEPAKAPSKPVQMNLFEEKLLTQENRREYRILGQIFDTYWLLAFQDKLFIIDQHAAHEKVKYERLIHRFQEKEIVSQNLVPPIVVTLSAREEQTFSAYQDVFAGLGFEIEEFGGSEYAIRSVPTDLYGCQEKELFLEVLDELFDGPLYKNLTVVEEKLASMACKAAVKGNHAFSTTEMEALIDELLTLDNPYNCPHGRPTIISMSKYEIEKKFKRIV
ncbi:MAG: DNA mismatch repair endonuclease MutL [Lachnospiraceae bacterium]|nr:DNA mismatch repair endonuclease MutL [Lachnospiraceae bacterium]